MAKPAKRHHVVSKFYLRYFADEAEQVTTVMLPGDRSFTQSIEDASVHKHFYTAIGHDGELTDAAERAMGLIEEVAAVAWRDIVAGRWPLPDESRQAVASWLALHLLRGTSSRQSMSEIGTELLQFQIIAGGRARLRETLKDLGAPHDGESVNREWISLFEEPLFVEARANHHLKQIADMLPRVTLSLLDRIWVLTTFQRKGLATSDHPVLVVPNPEHQAMGLGTGIETADTIHVALTRRHSLAMALRSSVPEIPRDMQQTGVTAVALYSNSCAVRSARRMLFHHPLDAPLSGLDLPEPRLRETQGDGNPWRFMPDADRQVLLDAGLSPPGSDDTSGR